MQAAQLKANGDVGLGNFTFAHEPKHRMLQFFGEARQAMTEAAEASALLAEHWDEVAVHKDMQKIDPDLETYVRLVEQGKLVVITARDEGSRLLGYALFTVSRHLHYKTVIVAHDDLYFVRKEYRHYGLGRQMIQFAESVLHQMGVQFLSLRTKNNSPHTEFLVSMGYDPIDMIYGKRLEA